VAFAVLFGAYLTAMHMLVDVSNVEAGKDASHRDLIYVYVHAGLFAAAVVLGFLAGKWFSGLGFAFATLFFIVVAFGVTLIQMSSYELACRGHNDIVRHWQC
jgi:hypothetical protein